VAFSDLNNELYTPKEIILAAKRVIAKDCFDLDPATSSMANSLHENKIAVTIYEESEDGFSKPWHGDVWLSPPVGADSNGDSWQLKWFLLAEEKFNSKEISSCLVLLKLDFAQLWFPKTLRYPHCFINSKISFMSPKGREKSMGDDTHVILYL
jgi:hypothetical protein